MRTRSAALRELNAGCEHVFLRLFGLAHDLPSPAAASDFIAAIQAIDPADLRLMLLGYYSKRTRRRATPDLILAAAAATPRPQRSFVTATADGPDCERALSRLLAADPATSSRRSVLGALAAWVDRVFGDHMATVGPILDAEVDRLRQRAAERADRLVPRGGDRRRDVVAEPGTETIEIFPHWALRPWNVFWEHGTAQIIGVAVPPERADDGPGGAARATGRPREGARRRAATARAPAAHDRIVHAPGARRPLRDAEDDAAPPSGDPSRGRHRSRRAGNRGALFAPSGRPARTGAIARGVSPDRAARAPPGLNPPQSPGAS